MPRWRSKHTSQHLAPPPDSRAFEAIVAEFSEPLLRFCRLRLNGDIDAAHDAAQEIFIDAWRSYARFTPRTETSLRAWLFTIARRHLADTYAKSNRAGVSLDAAAEIPDRGATPEEAAIERSDIQLLQELIGSLSGHPRDVIELRAADLQTKEIAAVLRITESNVRKIQERALTTMRLNTTHLTGGEW